MASFADLLRGIYSPVNEVREHSVNTYREMAEKTPDDAIMHLLETITNEPDVKVRQVAILMLRRAVMAHDESLWPKLTPESKNQIKAALVHSLQHEASPLMRNKINDAVSVLASDICGDGEWSELLDVLFALSKSENMDHRESALLIFGQLANGLTELLQPHLEQIRDIINHGMMDNSLAVRVSGLKATTGFIYVARAPASKAMLQPLVPAMLSVVQAAIQAKSSQQIGHCMEVFNDWSDDPLFFANDMQATLTLMFDIANNLDASAHQQSAVEFLVTLAMRNPNYMAQIPNYISSMVDTLLKLLAEVDDQTEAEWNHSDEDLLEPSMSEYVEESLDNFCLALRGKVVPHILGPLVQMINSTANWKHRYAGLMAVSLIAEGCKRALSTDLGDIVALLIPRLSDDHPRVRWAATSALGQLAHDFEPEFQNQFHESVLPMIINLYGDTANPKVQAIVSTAIVSYSEKAPPETLIPYMDQILSNLHNLMGSQSRLVLEEGVTCIGALASKAREHFSAYYSSFIPILKGILANTHDASWYKLRSKTLDTFSIIGEAVGHDMFLPDARDFMDALQQTHLGEYGKEDSMRENMLFAAARICKTLGEDFIPYLPSIMPSVLETASMNDQVYLDIGDDHDGPETQRDGWQYTIIGPKKFGIHISALDEKNTAVRMIYCFVDNLQTGILPYLSQIIAIVEPLTKFAFHKGIRAAAAMILPLVLHTVKQHGEQTGDMGPFADLFAQFFNTIMEAIKDEEFNNIMAVQLDSISELIDQFPEQTIPAEFVSQIFEMIQTILTDMKADIAERDEKRFSNTLTPEEEHEYEEIDKHQGEICTELANVYGITVRMNSTVILPLFQEHVEFLMTLLPDENPAPVRQVGLCIFDDSIEHLKEPMQPLLLHILPWMIQYTQDESPAVRQAASYGLGTSAKHGGAEFANWIEESLQYLIQAIEAPGAREEEEFQAPTENAICAVGKIILYQPVPEDRIAALITQWLGWLPLFVDKLESHVCHGLLCSLIEQNHPHLWGENFSNLPKILYIISWCLTEEGLLYIDDEVHGRMRSILRNMHSSNPELLSSNMSDAIPPNQQQVISDVINSPEH